MATPQGLFRRLAQLTIGRYQVIHHRPQHLTITTLVETDFLGTDEFLSMSGDGGGIHRSILIIHRVVGLLET